MESIEDAIKRIKQELSQELSQSKVDFSKILELSSHLASYDSDNVRFSIDAGIINRLGKELVGRQETALSELVKNSYDADASTVDIYFDRCEDEGGTLIIKDNGIGMNREQLINGFMRLSSSDKIHNPKSQKYNRTRAGRKGIGRFATQRLGEELIVVTQTLDAPKALKVSINWNKFENDADLILVSNQIEEIEKTQDEGTILTINLLREKWNDASIKRGYRYISDLLQPFPLSKTLAKSNLDPGFKATCYRGIGKDAKPIVDDQKAFYDYALAEIDAYVDNSGDGYWNLKSSKVDVNEDILSISADDKIENVPFKVIKNVHFKAYYFIYDVGLMPPQTNTYIKECAREYGGIRLYRNGFRVLPYGELENDWLGLDASVRKRVILPTHGNNNFFGFIEIIDERGDVFEETSSREGLLEDEAFQELKNFAFKVLISAVLRIAQARGRKEKASDKKQLPVKDVIDDVVKSIDDLEKQFSEQYERSEKSEGKQGAHEYTHEHFRRVKEKLLNAKTQTESLLGELSLLRILAGLGLTITQFVHEIKHYIPAMELDITTIESQVDKCNETIDRLRKNISGFSTYTSYFDKAVSRNVLRELNSIELRDVVNDFEEAIKPELVRAHISFCKTPIGYDLYTIPMHQSEWASILMNFYTNSRKAIKRAGAKGKIDITYGKTDSIVYMEFSDNGDGIKNEHVDKVFDAFFTTSTAKGLKASSYQEITGTGLGLKIVKDIIDSYQGDIYITTPKQGYSTTIRVEIPKGESDE